MNGNRPQVLTRVIFISIVIFVSTPVPQRKVTGSQVPLNFLGSPVPK